MSTKRRHHVPATARHHHVPPTARHRHVPATARHHHVPATAWHHHAQTLGVTLILGSVLILICTKYMCVCVCVYICIYNNNKWRIFELSTVSFHADTKCQATAVRQNKKRLYFDQLLRPAVAASNVLATSLITLFS